MELNKADVKLLNYIYHQARMPATKIAKATGLSREQVDYKIKKYISTGLIQKFLAIFNYSTFGYSQYVILLAKSQNKRGLVEYLKKGRNSTAVGSIIGKYDCYSELIFKNEEEISGFLNNLLEKNKIEDYKLIRPVYAGLYPLKFINNKEEAKSFMLTSSAQIKNLKEADKKLLKLLEKNSREKLVNLASKLNISAELVLHKLKKLEKEKIILGTRVAFNPEKLGYFYSLIFVDIQNFSKEKQAKLEHFASQAREVNSIVLSLEKPNCILKLFHKTQSELLETIEEIKELFPLENIEIMFAKNEEKLDMLPFLD